MSIGAKFSWVTGERFVQDMLTRQRTVQSNVIDPWKQDVQRRITRMYQDGGRVTHEQRAWDRNTPWTRAAKGHGRVLIGGGGRSAFQFGRMNRSYKIDAQPRGGMRYRFVLTNRARSKDGFDYPSLHHSGGKDGGTFTVRPVTARSLRVRTPDGGVGHFSKTQPHRVPARPHLMFYQIDARALNRRMARFILEGRRDASNVAVG